MVKIRNSSRDRMRAKKEREEYSGPESMIKINRGFATRLSALLKGTPEAKQLDALITKNSDRIKNEYADTINRPLIS